MKEPFVPKESFDWRTGGRDLSPQEKELLQRLLLQDGRGEKMRYAEKAPWWKKETA